GGLWAMDSPLTLTNSTFSGNRVTGTGYSNVGGGMALYTPATLTNLTIANNYAGWVGGGIAASDGPTVTLRNSILSNNTAGNGGNDWLIRQQSSRQLTEGGGNIMFPGLQSNQFNRFNDPLPTANIRVADPRLGALQDVGGFLIHPLLTGSAAINSGVSTAAPTVDERGLQGGAGIVSGALEAGATRPLNRSSPTP